MGTRGVVAPGGIGCHALSEAETPGKGFLDTRKVLALSHLRLNICSTHKKPARVRDEPDIP